jgi:hypothetical protein
MRAATDRLRPAAGVAWMVAARSEDDGDAEEAEDEDGGHKLRHSGESRNPSAFRFLMANASGLRLSPE